MREPGAIVESVVVDANTTNASVLTGSSTGRRSPLPRATGFARYRGCDACGCLCSVACRYARLKKPTTVPPVHMPRRYTATKNKYRGAVMLWLKNLSVSCSRFWAKKTTIIVTMTTRRTR
jgi:hypothetical protein